MKKLLVTGANGFIGSNCLKVLQNKKFEIYALDKTIPNKNSTKIKWIQADLHDSHQVQRIIETIAPNLLLHLAWSMEPGMKLDSDVHYRWVNSSMDLIQTFARFGGKRVVISGTCAEYEWGNQLYCEHATPVKPDSVYGICKDTLHNKISTFCKSNKVSYTWGRIFFLYGHNENKKRLFPYVVNRIAKGKIVKTSHGNQVYDYLHVKDAAIALTKLLEIDFNGAVNICSGKPIRLRDLIHKIAEKMKGLHLIRLGNRKTKKDEPQFIVGNNQLLKQITDWEHKVDIDKGIDSTIKSILNEE